MKNVFHLNRALVIINVVLGFTIYLGLLFLIPLGIIQIIMSFTIYNYRHGFTKQIKTLFKTYVIITSIILIGILLILFDITSINQGVIYCGLLTSIIMAFLHLKITYLIYELEIPKE